MFDSFIDCISPGLCQLCTVCYVPVFIDNLHRLKNNADWFVLGLSKYNIPQSLKDIHWFPVRFHVERNILVFKILQKNTNLRLTWFWDPAVLMACIVRISLVFKFLDRIINSLTEHSQLPDRRCGILCHTSWRILQTKMIKQARLNFSQRKTWAKCLDMSYSSWMEVSSDNFEIFFFQFSLRLWVESKKCQYVLWLN